MFACRCVPLFVVFARRWMLPIDWMVVHWRSSIAVVEEVVAAGMEIIIDVQASFSFSHSQTVCWCCCYLTANIMIIAAMSSIISITLSPSRPQQATRRDDYDDCMAGWTDSQCGVCLSAGRKTESKAGMTPFLACYSCRVACRCCFYNWLCDRQLAKVYS